MRVVTKAFLRYLRRRRSLSLLQLLGITCGVAAAVGMALSARLSLSSFEKGVEFLKGQTTHSLERPAGPLEETILTKLMVDPAVQAFSPIIDRRIRLHDRETVRLLGIDPFLDQKIRPQLDQLRPMDISTRPTDQFAFILNEKAIIVDEQLALRFRLHTNQFLETSRGTFKIVGTFSNASGEPVIIMDIAHAQRLFELPGKIDRVDLIVSDEADFLSRWKSGFRILSGLQRQTTMRAMLQAFQLNLQALSMLALFVGVFLVYNTAMFTVVSRMKDAGILRSLGASRREILGAFSSEILLLGFIGGALGGLAGFLLSRFLNNLVSGTISNLYFSLRPAPLEWSWSFLLIGIVLGCGASLLGGIYPLIELIRVDPVQALRGRIADRGSKGLAWKAALVGVVVMIISLGLFTFAPIHVYFGFAGSFALLIGVSLNTGVVLVYLHPMLKKILSSVSGLSGKVAAGNIRQNLGRTAAAVAAFMVAISMAIGLSSMIGSFRHSLVWWMGTQLQADLFIGKANDAEVPESFYHEVRTIPGLDGLDRYRNVQVLYKGKPIYVAAVDASVLQKYTNFGWLKGGNENWEPVKKGAVIISESFNRGFGIKEGDTVTLEGIDGPASLKVAAIFYDYSSEHGLIMIDRTTYSRIFNDHTISTLGVFVNPGNPHRKELLEEIRQRAVQRGLPVFTRDQLWANILSVFDSTFAVTRSMQVLSIIVAFFGIVGALMTLFIERQREFGIYRALGFSSHQVAGITFMEGLGMSLMSFLMSIGVGTLLAWVLIRVINLHSFNWTIFFYPAWEPYIVAFGTTILVSLGAAIYPIWKVYKTYPQMQIREE
ncbi:MAG TPA: FtsX-like permease family protein [Syntrophales bacterium]|nr:FtsX-like permease family protein [Syntrophales bacterium]